MDDDDPDDDPDTSGGGGGDDGVSATGSAAGAGGGGTNRFAYVFFIAALFVPLPCRFAIGCFAGRRRVSFGGLMKRQVALRCWWLVRSSLRTATLIFSRGYTRNNDNNRLSDRSSSSSSSSIQQSTCDICKTDSCNIRKTETLQDYSTTDRQTDDCNIAAAADVLY